MTALLAIAVLALLGAALGQFSDNRLVFPRDRTIGLYKPVSWNRGQSGNRDQWQGDGFGEGVQGWTGREGGRRPWRGDDGYRQVLHGSPGREGGRRPRRGDDGYRQGGLRLPGSNGGKQPWRDDGVSQGVGRLHGPVFPPRGNIYPPKADDGYRHGLAGTEGDRRPWRGDGFDQGRQGLSSAERGSRIDDLLGSRSLGLSGTKGATHRRYGGRDIYGRSLSQQEGGLQALRGDGFGQPRDSLPGSEEGARTWRGDGDNQGRYESLGWEGGLGKWRRAGFGQGRYGDVQRRRDDGYGQGLNQDQYGWNRQEQYVDVMQDYPYNGHKKWRQSNS